jgi:hypothetical protein
MANVTQVNFHVDGASQFVNDLEHLQETYKWSKVDTVRIALQTLRAVMETHEGATLFDDDELRDLGAVVTKAVETWNDLMRLHEQIAGADAVEPDVGDLYRRVAREIPVQLIEPKGAVQLGWTDASKAIPAMQVDEWFIYADPESDELMAVDADGRRRGRVVGGEIRADEAPQVDQAVLEAIAALY